MKKIICICILIMFAIGCRNNTIWTKQKEYLNKGTEYYSKLQYDKAIEEFSKGLNCAYSNSLLDPKIVPRLHEGRAKCYFYIGDYENSWKDMHAVETFVEAGYKGDEEFIRQLKKASGREK